MLANKKQFSELVQEGNLEEELDISNETIQREEKHNLDKTPSNKSGEIIKGNLVVKFYVTFIYFKPF